MQPLDNPVWAALSGPQEKFSERYARSARFQPQVSLFAGLEDPADPAAWAGLAELIPAGERAIVAAPGLTVPPGFAAEGLTPGLQLVGTDYRGAPAPEAEELGAADVPEILELVGRTRPGPFAERTVELGDYLGIRRGGRLVAMAGVRIRPPGFSEISAVCTDPEHRGAGLATRLVAAVTDRIRARGDVPFLHVAVTNTGAVRLYEHLGFTVRTEVTFAAVSP
ncbi:GNAT family N-acetyltransferase [Actinoplanes sp. N902-109]|uniref:GNAT family N-acetyltransferase n=1 Tax=Actinoplanes sp. (strain N902-109) TaxID=649831 RepID=UPI00032964CF|nr:GNAT family N-acetyltransferase [Actinoplanes sp. N902-109]AGL17416.1 GCN5-related N-acetyltransferase [Actinoplanes sp. N902-109]